MEPTYIGNGIWSLAGQQFSSLDEAKTARDAAVNAQIVQNWNGAPNSTIGNPPNFNPGGGMDEGTYLRSINDAWGKPGATKPGSLTETAASPLQSAASQVDPAQAAQATVSAPASTTPQEPALVGGTAMAKPGSATPAVDPAESGGGMASEGGSPASGNRFAQRGQTVSEDIIPKGPAY